MPSLPPDWADAISRVMRGDFGPRGKSLQQDIADELADHLSQSMDRERRSGKSEDEAKDRVLNRFGSPSRIAARLWFDGMNGEIMFQRWMIGTTTAALVVAFLAIGFAFWSIQESNRTLLAAVEAMDKKIVPPAPSMDWVKLRFKCIDDTTGEPMKGVYLSLVGNLLSTPKDQLTIKTDKDGLATLGPVRVGNHEFTVVPNENWRFRGDLMVLPGQSDEIVIRCPIKVEETTLVYMRLPKEIQGNERGVDVELYNFCMVGDKEFQTTSAQNYIVTGEGKNWFVYSGKGKEVLNVNAVGIVLPVGTYQLKARFTERFAGWKIGQNRHEGSDRVFYSARSDVGRNDLQFSLVAEANVKNKWVFPKIEELPQEWLEGPAVQQTPIPRLPETRSKSPQPMLEPPSPPDDDLSLPDLKLPGTR